MAKGASIPTAEFFEQLDSRGFEPLLRNASGTIRFDLRSKGKAERWLLTVDMGKLSVSRRNARAACVVRTEKALFDGIVRGRVNVLAALLRGQHGPDGDPELLMRLHRIFPGPDDGRRRR